MDIPSTINGLRVAALVNVFRWSTNVTKVTIPTSVTTIGQYTFKSCTSLTNVTMPTSGVTIISSTAFESCTSLTNIILPSSVTNLGSAFQSCTNLTGVYFLGNKPSYNVGDCVFCDDNNVTSYYLPGTTGWSTTLGGRPTAIWQPLIQTTDASFGVQANQFGFNISWASGQVVVVEAAENLAKPVWSPVGTNTLITDTLYFSDPEWTNYPARLYRLRSP